MWSFFVQIVLLDHEGNRGIKETGIYATDDGSNEDNNDAVVKKGKGHKSKNASSSGAQVCRTSQLEKLASIIGG